MMRKKFKLLAIALFIAMVFGLVLGCATGGGSRLSFNPGTYRGTGNGYAGAVTVEVTVSANRIESVNVVEHRESPGISDPALINVPAQIVEHQTFNVDVVVGATVTRMAILMAAMDAVEQAGANPGDLMRPIPRQRTRPINKEVDVVVVGAGGAGMAAAISALQEGARSVVLIEKTAAVGGNTMAAGAGFAAWNSVIPELLARQQAVTGQTDYLRNFITRDPANFSPGFREAYITLQQQIRTYLAGDTSMQFDSVEFHMVQTYVYSLRTDLQGNNVLSDYNLARIMVQGSPGAIAWARSVGLQFAETVRGQPQHVLAEPVGAMWRRGMGPAVGNYPSWFVPMKARFSELGGELMYNTKGESLIVQGGRVVGVNAVQPDGTSVTIRANSVVLATGGFGANLDMVIEHNNFWASFPRTVGTTNVHAAQGEGIKMAQAVGAGVTQMGITQLMPIGFVGTGALATGHGGNVIYVDANGNRFVNEGAPRDVLSAAIFAAGGTFYEVRRQQDDVHNQISWAGDGSGRIFRADNVADLARQVGMNPDNLVATVNRFNGFVAQRNDPDFGRTIFMNEISGPVMFRVLSPSRHYTHGGLTTDTNARVLHTNGQPIPNLFAAGEIMGGIHGGNRLGGNAVAEAFVFGRIAGSGAAANARR